MDKQAFQCILGIDSIAIWARILNIFFVYFSLTHWTLRGYHHSLAFVYIGRRLSLCHYRRPRARHYHHQKIVCLLFFNSHTFHFAEVVVVVVFSMVIIIILAVWFFSSLQFGSIWNSGNSVCVVCRLWYTRVVVWNIPFGFFVVFFVSFFFAGFFLLVLCCVLVFYSKRKKPSRK